MKLSFVSNLIISDKLKTILGIILIMMIPIVLLYNSSIDHTIKITFLANIGVLSVLLWYSFTTNDLNLGNVFVVIFFYLFFIIAPILQLKDGPDILVNTLPYDIQKVFNANVLVTLFLSVYTLAYLISRNIFSNIKIKSHIVFGKTVNERSNVILLILLILSFIAAITALLEIKSLTSVLSVLENYGNQEDISENLIRRKVLYNFPLALFVYLRIYKEKVKGIYLLYLIAFLCILITKNPLLEKRNGLGATYLFLLFCILEPYLRSSRLQFVVFFLLFVIFFPISSILTHQSFFSWGSAFENVSTITHIIDHFQQLHYDAWANFIASIEYVTDSGMEFGRQLLGTLFFYFPRSLWVTKPQPTGVEVGNFLIGNYNMWFDNLSSPLVAEGYVDFGISGLVLYAIILAGITYYLGQTARKTDYLEKYAAIYVQCSYLFILRGALMPAFAYTIGSLIAIYLIPKMMEFIVKLVGVRFQLVWRSV